MLILYTLIAIGIAWIWVDYFRLIDIYEKEDLRYAALMFAGGASSVFIVFALQTHLFSKFYYEMNGGFVHDFIYTVLKIGIPEEFAKIVPFLVFYKVFKKQVNEPIDFIFYCSVSALGFSAFENVLYFMNSGPSLINGRAILSTVGHMFDTSIIAYGFVRYKYYHKRFSVLALFGYFVLAASVHGFYDFWLMYQPFQSWGWIVTFVYFVMSLSIFAGILNNALNNSEFFTYEKAISSRKVTSRILIYYGIVFLIQLVLLTIENDLKFAFQNFVYNLLLVGIIITIAAFRLGRFTLIRKEWAPLPIEFPFLIRLGYISFALRPGKKQVRDIIGKKFYRKPLLLIPESTDSIFGTISLKAIVASNFRLNDDTPIYELSVENIMGQWHNKTYLINSQDEIVDGKLRIAVYEVTKAISLRDSRLQIENFPFIENASISLDHQMM